MSLWTTVRNYSDYQSLSPAEQQVFIEQGIESQGYKCALCGRPLYYDKKAEEWPGFAGARPVVDHDHKTGIIRGILHAKCNTDLAVVENNGEAWIQRARKYLGYDNYVDFPK